MVVFDVGEGIHKQKRRKVRAFQNFKFFSRNHRSVSGSREALALE